MKSFSRKSPREVRFWAEAPQDRRRAAAANVEACGSWRWGHGSSSWLNGPWPASAARSSAAASPPSRRPWWWTWWARYQGRPSAGCFVAANLMSTWSKVSLAHRPGPPEPPERKWQDPSFGPFDKGTQLSWRPLPVTLPSGDLVPLGGECSRHDCAIHRRQVSGWPNGPSLIRFFPGV